MSKKGSVVGAKALGTPVSEPFTRMFAAPEAGAARVNLDEDLTVTVLNPHVPWLWELADWGLKEWQKRIKRDGADLASRIFPDSVT